MASTIQVDKIQDTGGNTILSSNSTGTFTYEAASGANFTALDADNISAGTLAVARGGTGGTGGAGKILQVVSSNLTTQMTSTSTSYVDTGLTATITPSATSSKVLVLCNVCFTYSGDNNGYLILLRDTTEINSGSGGTVNAWTGINSNVTAFAYSAAQQACNYLDSPSTTSATCSPATTTPMAATARAGSTSSRAATPAGG